MKSYHSTIVENAATAIDALDTLACGRRVLVICLQLSMSSCPSARGRHAPNRAEKKSHQSTAAKPHSEPAGAAFSATDRFMNNTAKMTTNVNTAAIQKVSKNASEDACC